MLSILFACAAMEELIKAPSVKVDSVSIARASFQDIDLNFNLLIDNPNPYGVQLDGFDYNLTIEGNEILTGDKNQEVRIASANTSHLSIPITIDFSDLYSLVTRTKTLDSLSYSLKGHFKPGGILAGIPIPFSTSGSFPNIRIPKLSFRGLKVNNINLSGVDLQLGLILENINSFGLNIGKLNYQIDLAGNKVATGLTENLASVPAKGSGDVTLPISLNFAGLTSSLRSLLTQNDIDCAIKGSADLASPFGVLSLPINTQQKIRIVK